jgi:DNA-binding MarR family transcriptional regulator
MKLENEAKEILGQILKKLESMEQRLDKLEGKTVDNESQIRVDLPPALARMLKLLSEANRPAGSEEVSGKAGLSRNLTSAYLSRLVDMGYVTREPNLDKSRDARFVFKLNKERLPENIRKLIRSSSSVR